MYGKHKKVGYLYSKGKKKMSATRRAYLAGMRKGRAMARARSGFRKRRWY